MHIRKTRSNQIITCRLGQTLAASGLLATLLVGCVSPIDAPPQETAVALSAQTAQGSFDARLRQAEFIFQGVVTDVTYARSQPTELDGDRLPHTFVTFQIERIFKGRAVGNTVTVRFLGGQRPDGSYMMSSAAPLFDVGRHCVLADTGSEVIAGSTRMKAGTAQKIVLNLISTALMVQPAEMMTSSARPA